MRCSIAIVLVCACSLAAAAPQASIELLPQATVSEDAVVLGQVAHLRSADLHLMRKLVELPLGRAPQPGQAAVVERASLASWIRRQTGLGEDGIEWGGAGQTRIVRKGARLIGADLEAAAAQALRRWLTSRGFAGEVRVASPQRDMELPAGEVRLQARTLEQAALRRRMLVWVDVWSGGSFVRAVPVSLEVAVEQVAGASAGDVGAHGPLQQSSLSIAAQRPDAPVAVARGEWAALRTVAGVVALESRVEVLQDGRLGQRIRVRQPGATGIVFATVTAPGQLELAP